MIDTQFEDLKQFIDGRISQSEQLFEERFGKVEGRLGKVEGKLGKLESGLQSLRTEMLDGFAGVGDAIEDVHQLLEETKLKFDKRLSKLEKQAA